MKEFLISVGHLSIFIICYGAALAIYPLAGSLLIGMFMGGWISVAMGWKRRCRENEGRLEDLIDVNKVLERKDDPVVKFEVRRDGKLIKFWEKEDE